MAVMTAIGIGLAAYGAYQSTRGAIKANQAQKALSASQIAIGEASAEQQEWNAQIAEVQAQDAILRGQDQEAQVRLGTKGLIGAQRAGFAGQGLDISVGSPVNVTADTAYLGELDALTVRANAAREAWGYQVEAADRRMAAGIARKGGQAQAQASSGRYSVANTLIGGVGQTVMLLDQFGWGKPKPPAPDPPKYAMPGAPGYIMVPGSPGYKP